MTSQTRQNLITIHTLPNISRRKGNQTMKIGQLQEYNMRNTFLEKSYTKCGGEASSIKNENWAYLGINSLKCYKVYLLYVQVEVYQNILKLR